MQWLPPNVDVYTIFGGLLAAISAIFTIISGIGQLFSPVIATNKIDLLARTLQSETSPQRKQSLQTTKLRIESNLLAREIVPWWRFGINSFMLISIGLYVAYPPPSDAPSNKEFEYALTGLVGGTIVLGLTFQTFQERIRVSHQYLSSQDPYTEVSQWSDFHFLKSLKGCAISAGITVVSIAFLVLSDHALNNSLTRNDLGGYFIFTMTGYVVFLSVLVTMGKDLALKHVQKFTDRGDREQDDPKAE